MVFKKLMGRLLNPEYGGLMQQDAHEVQDYIHLSIDYIVHMF